MTKVLFFFLISFSSVIAKAQHKNMDSLLKALKAEPGDTEKVKKINKYSWDLINEGDNRKAENLIKESIQLSKKLNYKPGLAWAYHLGGIAKQEEGNYPESLRLCLIAMKLREELKDEKGIAGSLIALGNISFLQENNTEALYYFTTALQVEKKIHNRRTEAMCYYNIGVAYRLMKNYDLALKNQQESIKIREEIKDSMGVIKSQMAIANIFMDLGRYDEALKLQLTNAEEFVAHEEWGNTAICYGNIGSIYLLKKNHREALKYFRKCILMEKNYGSKEMLSIAYEGMSTADSALGNMKESFEFYKLHILYKDSLINEENTKKLIQSQMQYDFDKRSAADSVKNAESKKFEEIKYQQEISRQKTFTYGGIAGVLVMIIVAGVSFMLFRNKKKANIEIQRQKHIVEEKQKEILDSIYYARRIQRSLLPSEKYIEKTLKKLNLTK